jgi:phage/plasmid-associated DNA primase
MPKLNGFDYPEFQKFLTSNCGPQYIKKVYKQIFEPQYKCLYTKYKEGSWYKFNKETTLWLNEKHEIIVDDVYECLDKLFTETYELLGEDDPRRKQVRQARVKLGIELADDVTKRLMTMYHDETFKIKLDTTVEVFNFKNGLLDLKTMNFRKRTAEDFYTKCLPFDYNPKRGEKLRKLRKKIRDSLLKVCNNNDEDLDYLLQSGAYGLTGRNDLKGMLFLYGPKSNNGKSTYFRYLMYCMSCYCGKISAKSFSSGKEHKFLMDAINLRCALIEELDKASQQDTGLFKEVIDGDSIKLELLYSNGTIELEPKFLLMVTCNTIPNFITADEGVKNRSKYLKFDNQFLQGVEDCPEKGIYKADTSMKEKIKSDPKTQEAFVYMMIDEVKKFYVNHCKLPEMRKEQEDLSEEIKNVGDIFKEFIEKYFEKTEIKTDRISKKDIRELYNDYSHNYGKKASDDKEIMDNMGRLGYTYKKDLRANNDRGVFIGLKQIKDSEDIFLVEDSDSETEAIEKVVVEDSETEAIEKVVVVVEKQTVKDILNEDSIIVENIMSLFPEDKKKSKKSKKIKKVRKTKLDMDFDNIIECSEQLEQYI